MNRRQFSVLMGSAACGVATGAGAQAPIVMKIGTATLNDAQHEWIRRFGAALAKSSGDRIKVEAYPSSQLGSIPRMIEQTQFGTAQGFVGPAEFMTSVDGRYALLGAPGIFADDDHAERVIQDPAFRTPFLAIGERKGLKGLGLFLSGPATFVTTKPVRKLADFAGLKIRVTASELQSEQVRAVGATPVPLSLGEVLPAFQQGTLDGVMGNSPVFEAFRYYTIAKYQLVTNQMMYVSNAVTSQRWFDGLPADLKPIVTRTADEVSRDLHGFAVERIESGYKAWRAGGGEIVSLPEDEQKKLVGLLKPIGTRLSEKRKDDQQMMELLTSVADKHKRRAS